MAAGQTIIKYNGIKLLNVVTNTFAQEAVTDPSGADLLYHRFTVEVTGYITGVDLRLADPPPTVLPSTTRNGVNLTDFPAQPPLGDYPSGPLEHNNPTIEEVAVRSALMEPRREFEMWEGCNATGDVPAIGDVTYETTARPLLIARPYKSTWEDAEFKKLSPNTGSPDGLDDAPFLPKSGGEDPLDGDEADYGGYDINNGPRCTRCDVTRIVGNNIFHVSCRFEICKVECDRTGRAQNNTKGVISNRWSVSDVIDANRNTVRTISGQLRCSSTRLNANSFRGWVVAKLQAGFRRERMDFTVTPDGLWLNYTITDREVHYSCPPPATSWDFTYTESAGNGRVFVVQVDLTLRAPRHVKKTELAVLGHAIIRTKLLDPATGDFVLIQDFTVIDSYSDNDSSITMRCVAQKTKPDNSFLAIGDTGIGTPLTAADFAAQPTMVGRPALSYDSTKSLGGYVGDVVELAGSIGETATFIVSAWSSYLQSPCDEDHDIGDSALSKTVDMNPVASVDFIPIDRFAGRTDYTLTATVADTLPTKESKYISSAHKTNPYTHWQMDATVKEDRLRVQMPIASSAYGSSGASVLASSVVSLSSNGATQRVVRAKGTRLGMAPSLPALKDHLNSHLSSAHLPGASTTDYGELLDCTVKEDTPERTVDGQLLFTSYVELIYAAVNPLVNFATGLFKNFRIGHNPWETVPPTEEAPSVDDAPMYTSGTGSFTNDP